MICGVYILVMYTHAYLGICPKMQRKVAKAIRQSRKMGKLPLYTVVCYVCFIQIYLVSNVNCSKYMINLEMLCCMLVVKNPEIYVLII